MYPTPDTQSHLSSTPDPEALPSDEDLNGIEEHEQKNDDAEAFFSEEEDSPSQRDDVTSDAHKKTLNVDTSSDVPVLCEDESLNETLWRQDLAVPDETEGLEETGSVHSPNHSLPPIDDDSHVPSNDASWGRQDADTPNSEAIVGGGIGGGTSGYPQVLVTSEESPDAPEESFSSQDPVDPYSDPLHAENDNEESDLHHPYMHAAFADEGHPYYPLDGNQGPPIFQEAPQAGETAVPPHWSEYADPYADLMIPFCKFFAQGRCTQGGACRFRHSLSINEYALLFHDPQPPLWNPNVQLYQREHEKRTTVSSFNVCKFYPLGKCRNGEACPYLHIPSTEILPVVPELPMGPQSDESENVPPSQDEDRTRPCKYYMESGNCRRGDQCYYIHDRTVYGQSADNTEGEGRTDGHGQWHDSQDDGARYARRRTCNRFQEGYCSWGDRCKYLHESPSMQQPEHIEGNSCVEETPEDNGWGADAGGWGTYIDEWAPKEQKATTDDSSQPAHEEQPTNDTWPPKDKDDPWAPKPLLCSYYARGHCKKANRCNLSHAPEGTPKGGSPRNGTSRHPTPSRTPVPSRVSVSRENHHRADVEKDGWGTAAPDETSWGAPEETESLPITSGGWPDGDSENEFTPWAAPKQPICDFYARGHCNKGMRCQLRHESPLDDLRNETEDISPAMATVDPAAEPDPIPAVAGNLFPAVEEYPDPDLAVKEEGMTVDWEGPTAEEGLAAEVGVEEEYLAAEEECFAAEEGLSTHEDPAPPIEEAASAAEPQVPLDEHEIPIPPSPNEDEKTWAVEWSHEVLEPAQIQAPCKAFGQGHCPFGDSCLYQHIVEVDAVVEDRQRNPSTVESPDGSVHNDVTETPGTEETPIEETPGAHVESELVVERELFNCTVRFGLDNGCSPTNLTAASDSCRAIVSNLPPDIPYPEAVELAETIDGLEHEVEDIAFELFEAGANVIMKYVTPQDAVKAVIKLHGQTYDIRPLTARLATESVMSPLECKTVKITWPSPSRSVWAYYPTISSAKAHEKRLDGWTFQGRKLKAAFSRPRPNDTTFAVKLNGFLVGAEKTAIEELAQASLVHLNAPTYSDCPLDSICDTLAARGSLERFYRLPLDPVRVKHVAFASFDAGLSGVMGAHGVSQPFLGDISLSLQKVFHANYKISTRRYEAIRGMLEQLREACQEHCTLRISDDAEPVDIHMFADAEERSAFGAANRELQAALQGEVMTTSDGATVWDEYFDMSSSGRAVEKINADTGFFVKVDHRMQRIRVLGDGEGRARARGAVLKLLKKVRAQRHVVPLELHALRMLVDGGYTELQAELGANKVTLDVTVPELIVRGDADVQKARAVLAAAAASPPGADDDGDADASGDSESGACPVCRRSPRNPAKLSCRHVYCRTCLQYVLQASAGLLQFAPPRCIAQGGGGDGVGVDGEGSARCGEYVPYVVVRDLLRTDEETALLRNAFLAHVRARPEAFFFCPTPHCETVYRRVAEERVGAPVYACPGCFTRACSACGLEYHEGLDCMGDDGSVATG